MPRRLHNWTFKEVVEFLREHGFRETHSRGSHFYYLGSYGGQPRQTHVQFHAGKTIHPRTLNSIIQQSGIPKDKWINW